MRSLLSVALVACAVACAVATPLDDYVNFDDGMFSYQYLNKTLSGTGWTGYIYNMTSQRWLTPADTTRPIWWHTLVVIIPDKVDTTLKTSMLYITGGDNRNPNSLPDAKDEDITVTAAICINAKSSGAVLFQVPNQPITFANDPWHHADRTEDAAIAFTWWHYMVVDPNSPNWVLELPMTKSAVKAIDALQEILPTYLGGQTINGFTVAGASKRGWTTWLVGAVEQVFKKRAVAIMPIVLDALNVPAFFHRQWQFYGAWSFALTDYYQANITKLVDSPNMAKMLSFIDPYQYRDRLTMPKLAVNAGGDEFQMPDDHRYWGHDMVGEMNFLLLKNAEHSCATGVLSILETGSAFVESVQSGGTRPTAQWSIDDATGRINVTTSEAPVAVDLTYSDSGEGVSTGRRDFRWAALNTSWCPVKIFGACVRPLIWETTKEWITFTDATTFSALAPLPAQGWRAFTLEITFNNPSGPNQFMFTVPASVIPNTLPFPPCEGEGCYGTLV